MNPPNASNRNTEAGGWFQFQNVEMRNGHFLPILILAETDKPAKEKIQLLRPILNNITDSQLIVYLQKKAKNLSEIEGLIHEGTLRLNLCLDRVPGEEENYQTTFIENGFLSLIDRRTNKFLANLKLFGFESNIKCNLKLDRDDCVEFLKIIEDKESYLHFILRVEIRNLLDGTLRTIESIYPLRDVLKDKDVDFGIKYYVRDEASMLWEPFSIPIRKRTVDQPVEFNRLFKNGSKVESLNSKLLSSISITPQKLNLSPIGKKINGSHLIQLDNLYLNGKSNQRIKSLPIIKQEDHRYWLDRRNKKKIWYQPNFEILNPELNTEFSKSSLQFSIKKIGNDNFGNSILEGIFFLEIKKYLDPALKSKIDNLGQNLSLKELNTDNAEFCLEVPYMDSSGNNRISYIEADQIERKDRGFDLKFRLSNEWIRVVYSLLALPDNLKSIRLKIDYNFQAYREIKINLLKLIGGFKTNAIPFFSKTSRSSQNEPIKFNAKKRSLELGNGLAIAFQDIKGSIKKIPPTKIKKPSLKPQSILEIPLHTNPNIINKVKDKREYALQTFGVSERLDLKFPCEVYGEFYMEENETGELDVIGCKEPYKLGTVTIPLYDKIEELNNLYFNVYRSTQRPNQFVVEPHEYSISRKPKNDENSYSPNILLYSTIDAESLENSNCVLDMLLEPNIPEYEIFKLKKRLEQYTSHEVRIEFITEVLDHQSNITWSVPSSIIKETITYPIGRTIRSTFSCGIEDMMIMKSMLENGSISGIFEMDIPEVGQLKSNLSANLNNICGPWEEGPLEILKKADQISVKNKIESTVEIAHLKIIKDDKEDQIILNQKIDSGKEITLEEDIPYDYIFPLYSVTNSSARINELRNYIEDVECQLVFVNNINFGSIDSKTIQIEFRLQGETNIQSLIIKESDQAKETFMLMPITDFLVNRVIEYKVKGQNSEWTLQDITTEGNIINLTSDFISN